MQDNKNSIVIYKDDIVNVDNIDGKQFREVDIWNYCLFFAENVQLTYSEDDTKGVDGISVYEYAESVESNQKELLLKLVDFTKDGTICKFQKDMKQKYNISVNAWALCNLCMFINRILECRWVILLGPTIEDTLNEIKELDRVAFINKDGTQTESSNTGLKDKILDVLKSSDSKSYEAYKMVKVRDVFTKELFQIEFLYYLSAFFIQYYKIDRKKAWLTEEEYNIIGYFLKWFGLSPVEVTKSRLRQLKMKFNYIGRWGVCHFNIDNKDIYLQLTFIKYSDWKDGKINLLKQDLTPLEMEESIYFPQDFSFIKP